ncbi:hypothetical protein FGU65_05400 [Methanoculleus sp. FWC-SCC1]|uniref:Alcohol dehydrogenase n=1 Tax=Methanoculleus frigidifontis TaxID=2584085 RepID=A0ABT8M8T6_9EURY|nr:hypothetical protein [Methanoculleus sp. FWC-SCC1]MDN7024331.1 hypothetical protein [Methanoculleus sp. FWC-SCC1]
MKGLAMLRIGEVGWIEKDRPAAIEVAKKCGATDIIPIPRVGWGVGMANKTIVTDLCPGGRVRMERLAEVVMHGRMDPSLMATHVFRGFDRLEEALHLMKEKPRDLIKPVVIVEE